MPRPASSNTDRVGAVYLCQASSGRDRASASSYLCQAPPLQTPTDPAPHTAAELTSLDTDRSESHTCARSCLLGHRQTQHHVPVPYAASSDCQLRGLLPGPGLAPSETDRPSTSYVGPFLTPQAGLINPVPHTCAGLPLGTLRPSGSYLGFSDLLSLSPKTHRGVLFTLCLFMPSCRFHFVSSETSEFHSHLPTT